MPVSNNEHTLNQHIYLQVLRVPDVKYKSFLELVGAQAWLEGLADAASVYAPAYQCGSSLTILVREQHRNSCIAPLNTDDNGTQMVQQHNPQARSNHPRPVRDVGSQQAPLAGQGASDVMNVDDDSDIEILPGPPSTRSQSVHYDDDSDIEILDGPPADWGASRSPTRAPQRQQQPVAEPPRQATPQIRPAAVEQSPKRELEVGASNVEDAFVETAPAGMLTSGPVHDIKLSPDQLYVLSKVKNGESVFFTGSAGTGKSVLLREIIKYRGGRPSKWLGVTASTGIASVNIGGCTLHSWAGIGLGKDDKDGLVGKILGLNAKAYKEDAKRRRELWAKKARGEVLSSEDEEFLATDPSETRESKVLQRWRHCKTLIIDESAFFSPLSSVRVY